MRSRAQTALGAVLFVLLLTPAGFLLTGGVLMTLTGVDRVATWGGAVVGLPLGAVTGWLVSRRLTPRAPRLVCTLGGLVVGGLVIALLTLLPMRVMALLRPPRRPTPEVLDFGPLEDLILGCLFLLGLPFGTVIGAVWGYRIGAETTHARPSPVPQPVDSPHTTRPE